MATGGLETIKPEDTVLTAQSRMLLRGYSQLAVPRKKGNPAAITWPSIAEAGLCGVPPESVSEALVEAETVSVSDGLLDVVPRIIDREFVFVRDRGNALVGIITTTDLSSTFRDRAMPFLLLGEIELLLRKRFDEAFDGSSLAELVGRSYGRPITAAADLTLGDYQYLLANPKVWRELAWPLDQTEFVASLAELRELRNEIVHLRHEPPEPGEIVRATRLLRVLECMS